MAKGSIRETLVGGHSPAPMFTAKAVDPGNGGGERGPDDCCIGDCYGAVPERLPGCRSGGVAQPARDRATRPNTESCLSGAVGPGRFRGLFLEKLAVDFIGARQGQHIHEKYPARMGIGWGIRQRMLFDLVLGQCRARLGDNKGMRHMGLQHIGRRDHHRLHHIGMTFQHGLHVTGIDVLATGDEHIVGPADEVKPAILVLAQDVAGIEPPVVQAFRGLHRQIVIADHNAGIARM